MTGRINIRTVQLITENRFVPLFRNYMQIFFGKYVSIEQIYLQRARINSSSNQLYTDKIGFIIKFKYMNCQKATLQPQTLILLVAFARGAKIGRKQKLVESVNSHFFGKATTRINDN